MSKRNPKLSLVIPLFNEEENLKPLLSEVKEALQGIDYELILVDDCSTDKTLELIPKDDERVRVLAFAKNSGQSAAIYAGMNAAHGTFIALIDGDMQNDPADIPNLLAKAEKENFDIVCGYRKNRQDTLSKRLQSKIANAVRSRMTGDGVRDTGCSLKVMRQKCVGVLPPFNGMHRFIPALTRAAGFSLAEMPVNHRPRLRGQSKYGLGNRALRATADMFGVMWLNTRTFQINLRT